MEKPVLLQVEAGTALVTLNRPERRNALNQALLTNLYDILEEVSADEAVRAVILTGNGRSFCSGIDLDCILKENLFDPRGDGRDFVDIIRACRKPVIGAVNGHAITGGFEIALNCDFLVASDRASFADTHARVGIVPGWGMTQLLQQAVGQRMAKQLSLTCQFISAEKALQCGLVNEVVPHDELLPRARQIAGEIAAARPDTLRIVKELIEFRNTSTLEGSLAEERRRFLAFARGNLQAS
jgi:enoyl-CoA hydratase